jgi:hypothetical protein
MPISAHSDKHISDPIGILWLFTFGPKKTDFRIGRHENKEKTSLLLFLPIQIQLLDTETNQKPKIDSP